MCTAHRMCTAQTAAHVHVTQRERHALVCQNCDGISPNPRTIERWHHTRIRGRVADVLTIFTPYSHIHTIFTYSHHIRRRFAARFHVFTHIHTHSYPFTLVNVRKGQLSIVVWPVSGGQTLHGSGPSSTCTIVVKIFMLTASHQAAH